MQGLRRGLKAVAALLVIFGALGGLALWSLGRPQRRAQSIEAIQAREGIPVEVARAEPREFTDYFYCDGEVVDDVRSVLRAKVREVVEAVHARVGEPVEPGQVLVEFRTTDLEAAIEAAEVAYAEAERNYERYLSLAEQDVISADRLDQARTAQESAAAALRAARSQLEFARVASPIDGVVQRRWVEPGEFKGTGDELLSIVDLSTVEVKALVPEADVAALSVGMEGEFMLEADGAWRAGRISRISPSTADPNRFFDVFLKVENERTGGAWLMRPGMYVEVRFARGGTQTHPAVPESCLVLERDKDVIYLVESAVREVPVRNPATSEEEDGGFGARLARGVERIGALVAGLGGKVREEEQPTQKREVHTARRLEVSAGLRREGWVRLEGDPVQPGRLVIENPREAVEDGTFVRIVEGPRES